MPIGDLLAQITGETPPPAPPKSNFVPKRKADDDLPRVNDKQVKREQNTANISRPISQIRQPAKLENATPKTQPRPSATVPSSLAKMATSAASTPGGSGPPTPTTTGPSKPPKKGSFAEIMARGKVAQATLGQIGKIQHKKIEKVMTKRERQEMRDQRSQKPGSNGRPRPAGERSVRDEQKRSGDMGKGPMKKSSQPTVPEKKVKKAAVATTGYTGTARQIPGSNKSSKSSSSHRPGGRGGPSSRRDEYESEEDEEDEEDYYSDASSDMEAGAFEVDEEEARAARIARKEDELALAEENRHKREKDEKRRILAALAAGRNKR